VLLARARLLYREWLRHNGRRTEARDQLRTAHEKLTAMGVEAFAQRAAAAPRGSRDVRSGGAQSYHLHKVFAMLDISSRGQVERVM
jgi:hypothetical protein